jgi:hypothetical protein
VTESRYEQERIRQALATDPRVAEPDLSVDMVAGRILVTGSVPSKTVADAIDSVVAEVAPDANVDNKVTVPPKDEPRAEEPVA